MSVDDDIRAAQAARSKKDAAGVVQALERALEQARADAPLEVRAVVLIHHDHTGLGVYTPAPGDRVEGRRARLYVEVANHTHSRITRAGIGDVWRLQLDVTGAFAYEADGEVVQVPPVSLGTQSYETRTPAGVTSFGVELRLGEAAPAGVYRLMLRVKDAVGNKTATRAAKLVVV